MLTGNELMRREQYAAAVEAYTRAIQLDSTNAVYYCNRSAMYRWITSIVFITTVCIISINSKLIELFGGSVVRVLDSWPRGREFDSRPVRHQVTSLGKLFTPTCLCRCTWSSGCDRLVTFCRLRVDSHRGHLQATLSKLLTYCVLRSTQPPALSGTGNE